MMIIIYLVGFLKTFSMKMNTGNNQKMKTIKFRFQCFQLKTGTLFWVKWKCHDQSFYKPWAKMPTYHKPWPSVRMSILALGRKKRRENSQSKNGGKLKRKKIPDQRCSLNDKNKKLIQTSTTPDIQRISVHSLIDQTK